MSPSHPIHEPPHAGSPHARPKGILKNRSSSNTNIPIPISPEPRPDPSREMSEREIVLVNTLANAGPHGRSASRGAPNSRRQSGSVVSGGDGDTSPKLKWDEANLYLAEQEREAAGARMKIDEPKTPFAKQYDPMEDDVTLHGEDLMVDEMDTKNFRAGKLDEIPGLELGEPEMDPLAHMQTPEGEKRVIVDETMGEEDEGMRHGEEFANLLEEEKEKHKKFEQLRKKHYEMKNIKDLLGHPEQLDEDEDDDAEMSIPRTANGQ